MDAMRMPARLKYILLTLLFIVGSINMLSTTRKIMKSSKRLDSAKADVLALQAKKTELLENVAYKETEEYVEEIARNELNLIKPGEDIYIYPKDVVKKVGNSEITDFWKTKHDKSPLDKWKELIF